MTIIICRGTGVSLLQGVATVPDTQSRVHVSRAVVVQSRLLVQLLAVELVGGGVVTILALEEHLAVGEVLHLLAGLAVAVGDERGAAQVVGVDEPDVAVVVVLVAAAQCGGFRLVVAAGGEDELAQLAGLPRQRVGQVEVGIVGLGGVAHGGALVGVGDV